MLGATAIIAGIRRLVLRYPPEEEVMSRKAELQEFVHKFRKTAEAHEKVYIVSTDLNIPSTQIFLEDTA